MSAGAEFRSLADVVALLGRVGNQLAFGIVVAAIAVVPSLLTSGGAPAAARRLWVVGLGLRVCLTWGVVAGLMGVWMLVSTLRSGGLRELAVSVTGIWPSAWPSRTGR